MVVQTPDHRGRMRNNFFTQHDEKGTLHGKQIKGSEIMHSAVHKF